MQAIVSPAPAASSSQPAPKAVDCPAGILALFLGAIVWLVVASALTFINSLKFHAPGFLASEGYLSYGRVHAAQNAAFLYGFAVPAALGLGLWLLCRLGRTVVVGSMVVFVGAALWHTAVACGILGLFCGMSTGFEYFELPIWCAPGLILGYVLVAVCGLLTFHQRQPGRLYPSQWFVVGAFLWFPWIFSTAAMVLLRGTARGVLQATTAWWFAHNFDMVFLGFAGLASAFYFVPKLLNRPLHSHYLAAFAFWTLALFGGFGGIPNGAPVPSWLVSLTIVGTVLTVVPMVAIAVNFGQTAHRDLNALDANPTLRFSYLGLIFWIIAGAQQVVGVLPSVSSLTDFTWFGVAQKDLLHYGFFVLTIFGALYYIVPRLLCLDDSAWCPILLKFHFGFSFLGVLIAYISLLVTGLEQGILLTNGSNAFVDVMRRTMFPLRMSTLGDLLVFGGAFVFLLNFIGVLAVAGRKCCEARKGCV